MPGQAKGLIGTVVSDKMSKTVVVLVETTTRHRLYRKILRRSKRYQAHDDRLEAKPGDRVRILATRPLSRHKRWRVAEILQRGEVAEVAPREIDSEYFGRRRERAPVEETPATGAKAQTVTEDAPATEEAPAAEAEPQVATEDAPAADEAPAAEAEPQVATEDAPAADEAPAAEAEPQAVTEDAPAAEEPAADEPKPAEDAPAAEEQKPAEEPPPDEPVPDETTEERDAP